MTELTLAIKELKKSAYTLRLYNQRLVLIFLDAAVLESSAHWYDVAANAWPILVADETPRDTSLSKRKYQAHRKLLDEARSKIMLALSKDLEEAEALIAEAKALHDRAANLLMCGKIRGFVSSLIILAGY